MSGARHGNGLGGAPGGRDDAEAPDQAHEAGEWRPSRADAVGRSVGDGADGLASIEWSDSSERAPISAQDIAGAARTLLAAYGPRAVALMKQRRRAVRRRGDRESAALWRAVEAEMKRQLGVRDASRVRDGVPMGDWQARGGSGAVK